MTKKIASNLTISTVCSIVRALGAQVSYSSEWKEFRISTAGCEAYVSLGDVDRKGDFLEVIDTALSITSIERNNRVQKAKNMAVRLLKSQEYVDPTDAKNQIFFSVYGFDGTYAQAMRVMAIFDAEELAYTKALHGFPPETEEIFDRCSSCGELALLVNGLTQCACEQSQEDPEEADRDWRERHANGDPTAIAQGEQ